MLDAHVLILECDENQHKERSDWCECARMVNICNTVNAFAWSTSGSSTQKSTKPVVFLRYNPHPYADNKGHRIDPKFNIRMFELKKWILHFKKDALQLPAVSVVTLFFDGHDMKCGLATPASIL